MALIDGSRPFETEHFPKPSAELQAGLGHLAAGELHETEPSGDVYIVIHDPETLENYVYSELTFEDYERVTPPEEWALLLQKAEDMKGKKVVRVNATPAGGGVAIMNKPWVHMMNLLGVDAHWYSLPENTEAAQVTKWKMHNVMQAVSPDGVELTEEDIDTYYGWIDDSFVKLAKPLHDADVILIDDWQPSGLIPYIKGDSGMRGINPEAPILFRDHIHTRGDLMVKDGTPQKKTWDFLWHRNRIKDADVFITHPKPEFVPPNVPLEQVVYMPATVDLLDDLNREINDSEEQAGLDFINNELAKNEGQSPLDLDRPLISLVARFDESKNMEGAMASYKIARQKMLAKGMKPEEMPQLVLLGNGARDDPSGDMMLEKIMKLRSSEDFADIMDDIKVIRVPHNDIAINALLKNTKVGLQPSIAEGFESRVTDAMLQGVPVIGSDRGGIPLQIPDKRFVIDPYDYEKWADRIIELITDDDYYRATSAATIKYAKEDNYQFTTIPNLINWLHLSSLMLDPVKRANFNGDRRWVRKMALDRGFPEPEALAA